MNHFQYTLAKPIRGVNRALAYTSLTVAAAAFIFPFYWLLLSSLKDKSQIFSYPPHWLPIPGTLQNFVQLFQQTDLPRAFLNSIIASGGNVALTLLVCSLAGYAFAKYPETPGRENLFAFVLATMMIPGAVLLIPTFLLMIHLHMVNTYWALILPGSVSAFGVYWMRQYIEAHVPDELIQAARIDGSSELRIFWNIVLPIARPALAALGIMQLIGSWNNLMWAFIVLRTPSMYTMPVVIYLLNGEVRTPYGMLMAGGLLGTLPLVLAFLVFQRQFISGITAGAVK